MGKGKSAVGTCTHFHLLGYVLGKDCVETVIDVRPRHLQGEHGLQDLQPPIVSLIRPVTRLTEEGHDRLQVAHDGNLILLIITQVV